MCLLCSFASIRMRWYLWMRAFHEMFTIQLAEFNSFHLSHSLHIHLNQSTCVRIWMWSKEWARFCLLFTNYNMNIVMYAWGRFMRFQQNNKAQEERRTSCCQLSALNLIHYMLVLVLVLRLLQHTASTQYWLWSCVRVHSVCINVSVFVIWLTCITTQLYAFNRTHRRMCVLEWENCVSVCVLYFCIK